MNENGSLRGNKKARLSVIIGLLIVVAIIGFLFEATRMWMIGIGVVLLVALGFEVAEKDIDLGTLVETGSVSDSTVVRDEDGNLQTAEDGGFLTRMFVDMEGNEVPEGTTGAKYADEYNCDDFATQPEAQRFFEKAGGVAGDINRLDGNKDGVACQALPAS